MLKLGAKWWISAFNAQGSRGTIVAVQVGGVIIYVATVEALRKKERQGDSQETIKNFYGFLSFTPTWMLMYFFAGFFLNLTLCMTKLGVVTLSFPDFVFPGLIYFIYIFIYLINSFYFKN
jgi:hypothetical protein